jgi:hypothetical protein
MAELSSEVTDIPLGGHPHHPLIVAALRGIYYAPVQFG